MRAGDVVGGRFEIERLAGLGGMGKVWRCVDRHTGQVCALKTLEGASDGLRAERFAREALILADLRHPSVVRYLASGETEDGVPYLAMEWLDGEDLRARLAESRLSIADAVALGVLVAEALGAAHQRGVVHRDVKPSNIHLIPGQGFRVKLLDFGIARRQHSATDVTKTGARVGTPRYMSPEQVRGARDVGPRADVFALGCVLYECLTGRPAFGGNDEMAVLAKILLDEPVRVGELRFAVPAALDALIARMLAKDPSERPPDGAAVAAELAALGQLSPVTSPAPLRGREALSRNEQRLLSVVLARPSVRIDRAAADHDDAEATKDVTHEELVERMGPIAARFGGQLERLADGSIVVTLTHALAGPTGPSARSLGAADQAAHAARCALALRAVAPELRVALATGRGLFAASVPVGDVIDRGVSLLRRLPRGSIEGALIALDEVTAGLLDARFRIEELPAPPGPPGAGGVTLALRGERDHDLGGRSFLGRPSPRVGRERELAQLDAFLDECVREPMAHAVVVTAPAGVGKSRLAAEWMVELRKKALPAMVLFGQGDPTKSEQRFGLLAAAVRGEAGIADDDRAEVRRRKLEARIGRHVGSDDVRRVAAFVGELAGVPFPDDEPSAVAVQLGAARQEPSLMADQLRWAWIDWLGAEAMARPVVIILDDLHLGDATTVRLVDQALRELADRPLMVVALARPNLDERFPRLWVERGVHSLPLGGLTRRAAETLARDVLGERGSPEVVAKVCERAAGNPLVLEELLRAEVAGLGHELPPTVLAMLQARLEALEAEARLVLRAASVLGERFRADGVYALVDGVLDPARADEWLDELREREVLVRVDAGERGARDRRYAFAHTEMRAAAYTMLTQADRLLAHRLAGAHLERLGDPEPAALAEHFEKGGAPARAVEWYRRAGHLALSGADTSTALDFAERGIACGASGGARGRLHLLQAEAYAWRGAMREALDAAQSALALLPAQSPEWFAALGEAATGASAVGDRPRLLELAARLKTLGGGAAELEHASAVSLCRVAAELYLNGATQLGDELLAIADARAQSLAQRDLTAQAMLARARELRASCRGDMPESLAHADLALAAFTQLGNRRYMCIERMNIGYGYGQLGAIEQAEEMLRRAASEAEDLGLPTVAAMARGNLAQVLVERGALDGAERALRHAVAEFSAGGDRRLEAGARAGLGQVLLAAGRVGDAAAEARLAVSLSAGVPPARALALASLSRVLVALDEPREARDAALGAVGILHELGGLDEGEHLVLLAQAEALHASGDRALARAAAEAAHQQVLARAARVGDPRLRASFLAHGPWVGRIREIYRELGGGSDSAESGP
jgi:tetratricopeptide (TPR) repeat protein